ncbi:MAG TPA: tRNA dihydrouridine synthase DusB [Ignavibacteriales bacterium]|nr:tRNA dihydrouridine synthase DusB [Ignavibacteriales bacterium]
MKIGNLDIGKKAILAPMAEVTDAPFRQICREYGAGLTFTQMVSAKGVVENAFATLKVLAFSQSEKPIGVQLLGSDPEYIGKAIHELKSFKPDLIDLNCGCSVSHVCRLGLGAGILDKPELLGKLVRAMVSAAGSTPVSVKIRAGRDPKHVTLLENARIIEDNGASIITVHGRFRSDSYKQEADWNWIKKVKERVSIPVVGNGSLFEAEDCIKMMDETGCDTVFIARGALGNPFIFSRLNAMVSTGKDPGKPSVDEVAKAALRHLQLLIKDSGSMQGVKKARKHLVWYFRSFNGITGFIDKIYSLEEASLVEEFISEHAEKIKKDVYPEEDHSRIDQSFKDRVLFWMNEKQTQEVEKQ